jgi:hypothetical protein
MVKKLKEKEEPRYRGRSYFTITQILFFLSEKYPNSVFLGELHKFLEKINERKFYKTNTKRILEKLISKDIVKKDDKGLFMISEKVAEYQKEWRYWKIESYRKLDYSHFYWMLKHLGLIKEPKNVNNW